MQVTITGGTGSLAEYVANELADKHNLVLFDRVEAGQNRFQYEPKGRLVVGDLTSFDDCQLAVEGSQAVIHLGAIPYPVDHPDSIRRAQETGRPLLPWDETMRVNTMGTYYLLEAAKRAGVKTVVAASSNCVLGHGFRISGTPFPIEYLPIDEAHRLDFEDSYSLSKHLNEDTLQAYSRAYGMHCYALRPAGVNRREMLEAFAKEYKQPEEWSDWLFAYVDIRDMARAFRMCLEASEGMPPFEAFYCNAADTRLLEDTRSFVARKRPDLLPKLRGIEGRGSLISTAKAERMFGWKPEHSWTEFLPAGARVAR
ncbi:MAG TPA: NAD(P)-dependent oxidoreductase [Chloroflexota bacterium]|jgi:nucleoside-diphosphate-sugar epimerase|nr:NAD(P)-dependent oxidoreductase [Chloroflexota bacterium]